MFWTVVQLLGKPGLVLNNVNKTLPEAGSGAQTAARSEASRPLRSLKQDSYQGMPSGMPPRAVECAGFSRCAATGKPRRLTSFRLWPLVASLIRLRKNG